MLASTRPSRVSAEMPYPGEVEAFWRGTPVWRMWRRVWNAVDGGLVL